MKWQQYPFTSHRSATDSHKIDGRPYKKGAAAQVGAGEKIDPKGVTLAFCLCSSQTL